MSRVYISVGTNIERYRHVTVALDALAGWFGDLTISPVYESESVGFEGSDFLNLVVGIDTGLSVGELSRRFKQLEADNGRARSAPKFSPRTLDLDILTYDDSVGVVDGVELPRAEILKNAFVLRPLADIAGAEMHPACRQTYQQLWQDYQRDQKLWPVDFSWQGRQISRAVG
ncbi:MULTISPECIES: 2-amino-4-hydroxy-6-hydroxymethyldihydropteridine diphosphokinase [Marinobacter]|uniref:2-amino-4-hydroxy-6- hydroxymethyldihydropteridine diphosphokinase n=1 Tax=Marinobacter TaxID=2742 RepID=UPI001E500682|nr:MULTISPECIES: 2-amino-4-hydroxy-6-hydroxymethyldihydropteridine diphosphokinase [Marinobacter]MDX5439356.1 2-amino-4-hydroxy-6-hydroxymethyldihydropteridine diphosphokinase [Alteromonadaceae bacterium]MCD1629545.1 2-amino-4-hydroxy-6-hydroxymethyldihydropteridine diphosphokinase [Marinobacter shengliensis]MDX5336148.1 2-amino-4-hydroxy-6-hydroxymethyldihydropteridine diphosphokinase [Marinobacter sp.]MDX5387188.1 2-amino-4-hydroxy-6-hydroxymethyldihydropteridine diphosphokinase [Marinobacter